MAPRGIVDLVPANLALEAGESELESAPNGVNRGVSSRFQPLVGEIGGGWRGGLKFRPRQKV